VPVMTVSRRALYDNVSPGIMMSNDETSLTWQLGSSDFSADEQPLYRLCASLILYVGSWRYFTLRIHRVDFRLSLALNGNINICDKPALKLVRWLA
jgi:hypothetical protein